MPTCSTGPCWNDRYFPLMSEPLDVVTGGGFIIISGRDFQPSGSEIIIQYSSDNGATWTTQNFGYIGGTWAQHITYGNGIFVGLVGYLSRIIGVPSGNTINWSINTGSIFISSDDAMTFDGSNFIALAPVQSGNPQRSIGYSSDGITWNFGSPVSGTGLRNLQYGNGTYVASFSNGIWYGNSLSASTPFTFASSIDITDLAFGSGIFLGTNDANVYTSTDGINWTTQANAPYGITGLTYDQNVFMAVNVLSTAVAVSTDAGVSWTLSGPDHQLPSSNTDPLQPQYIGYDIITGDATGNYIALFLPRQGLGIPQGVVASGACPCLEADFIGTPTSGTAPLTVNFTDLSTGFPSGWAWDFDNDGVYDSFEQNPTHTYNTPGIYSVKLQVNNLQERIRTKTRIDYIDVQPSSSSFGDYWARFVNVRMREVSVKRIGTAPPPPPIHDLPIQLFGSLTVFYTEATQTLPVNLFGSDGDNLFYTSNTQTLPINLSS